MHSKLYLTAKRNYQRGYWSKERLRNLVGLDTGITLEEYEAITGERYEGGEED